MSRYSNSYPEEAAMNEAVTVSGRSGLKYNDVESMARVRRSVGSELGMHVEVAQELHEQIGALHELLSPLLSPEPSGVTGAKMLEGPPCSELVSRAEAHTRSLREAVGRLLDLRDRIEL